MPPQNINISGHSELDNPQSAFDSSFVRFPTDSMGIDTSFQFRDILATGTSSSDEDTFTYFSLFRPHSLETQNANPLSINKLTPDWLLGVILLVITILTWLRFVFNKNLGQIFDAFFSNSITNQIVRDENILVQRASVLLTIIFNLVAAVLLYQISNVYDLTPDYVGEGFTRFILYALLISLIYSVKFILLKLTGYIFNQDRSIATYIFNIFLINNVLGIFLLPIVIGLAFLPGIYSVFLIYAGGALALSAFIYRLIRGLIIGLSSSSFSPYYLFLYLCTLEILPLLLVFKFLMGKI